MFHGKTDITDVHRIIMFIGKLILPQRLFLTRKSGEIKHHQQGVSPTLWLLNVAMENYPFIDGLPMKNGWIFPWQTVNVITKW